MSTLRPNTKPMSNDGSTKSQHHLDSADLGPKRRNAGRNSSHNARPDTSVHQQGKRGGQSMNHLLSFTLPPRSRPPLAGPARRSRRGAAYTPFNKERYVNAQYRFLVKPTGDYTAYFADPDIYLNWADILQVVIPTSSALAGVGSSAPISDQPREPAHEGAACPICLSPPTAPRMTKCGHVFCYPCILHYLTLKEDTSSKPNTAPTLQPSTQKWRRCPICWDAVYARDLKAVRWWDARAAAREHEAKLQEQYELERAQRLSELDEDSHDAGATLGDDKAPSLTHSHPDMLALRLIERPNVTTLALPQSSTWPASELDHPLIAVHSAPWHFQPDVMGFAKFMLATPELLIESLNNDLQELVQEIDVLKSFGTDASGLHFVALAQQKVKDQMQKVRDELDLPIVRSTIGQARNNLKDHQAALSGQLQRTDLSRRQRKRMERSQTDEEPDSTASVAIATTADRAAARDGTPEAPLGAEEFLAFRAQTQGGIIGASSGSGGATPTTQEAASQPTADATHKNISKAKPRKNVNPPQPESSSYVFFQAASGQSIFLHPLDTKILLSHYGAYAKLPRNLAVKVAGADEGSMNEELRRRCKYLNHIPMAADVVFIEVDWEHMDLIDKATLRPYEQALRQRRNRRRDRERREDRAKTRAEEAELISNQGGPAAAAAYRRQQEQLAAFTSEANFPSDGLSRSFGGNSAGGGASDGGGFASGSSPSFRESAMFGAERDFPIHPGGETEDFPDSLRGARHGLERVSISSDDQQSERPQRDGGSKPSAGRARGTATAKTVWGTPATSTSFARAIQGRADAHVWDDHMDDAWHELEEDYMLGATSSGRRPTAPVREARGLNRQNRPPTESEPAASSAQTAPAADAAKPKRAKKKLILTGGGGRGTR